MSIKRTISRTKSRLNWSKEKWDEIARLGQLIVKRKADLKEKRTKT